MPQDTDSPEPLEADLIDLGDAADLTLGSGKSVQEGKRQIYC